ATAFIPYQRRSTSKQQQPEKCQNCSRNRFGFFNRRPSNGTRFLYPTQQCLRKRRKHPKNAGIKKQSPKIKPEMRSVRNFKIVLVCLLVMGCGGGKNISSSKINKDINARETIKNYRENLPDFTTLVSRVQIDYDDGKNFNRITVNLRMKNKEALWASASIVGW